MGATSPFRHGGNQPIQTDFSTFKPKSIAQTVSEAQLTSHLQNLNQKQQSLSSYRYHEDFDRITNEKDAGVANYEQSFQNLIKYCCIISIFFTKKYIDYFYKSDGNLSLFKRYYFPITLSFFSIGYFYLNASQVGHAINLRFFRELSYEEKKYRILDEQMDLYRYVDDIKYRFDYKRAGILASRQKYHKGLLAHIEKQVTKPDSSE